TVAVDVYGLGGILYRMLTGQPPFEGETLEEVLLQVITREPIPPSRLRLGVPRDLEAICLKCLEKDPSQRYARAADLADDLGRFLDGAPVRARPRTVWRRGLRWVRRRPALAGLAAVLVVALLGLIAGGLLWYDAELRATAFQRLSDEQVEALAG